MEKLIMYRGKSIMVTSDMKFAVWLKAGHKQFGSLAGAQKAVDKEIEAEPFKRFEVVIVHGYKPETAKTITVVGARVQKRRSRNWGDSETWYYSTKDGSGKTEEYSDSVDVYKVEDKAKVEKILAERHELQKEIDALEKRVGAVDAKLDGISLKFGNFVN